MSLININYSYNNGDYQVSYKPITRPVLSWRNELSSTVNSIYQSTDKPIYIGMSGGVDGEAVARMFMENNLPFSAISLRYKNGENDHDLKYAVEFCKKHSINHRILEIDPKELYGPVMRNFMDQGYHAPNIYRYLQLYIIDQVEKLGGTAVLGAGEQVYYTDGLDVFIASSPELLISLDYCKNNNTKHYVNFFMNNPEMYAAYLQIKLIDTLVNNPKLCRNTIDATLGFAEPRATSPEKKIIYYSEWSDMVPRPKYSGFENIRPWRLEIQEELMKEFPQVKSVFIPVSTVKKQLGI